MDIAACPRCASLDMRVPTIQDGLWPGGGETNFSVCADCAYRGPPLLFAGQEDYMAFRASPIQAGEPGPTVTTPQRAMPAFIAVIALLGLAAVVAGSASALADAGAAQRVTAAAGVLVGLGVAAAFLRIALRSWRGA